MSDTVLVALIVGATTVLGALIAALGVYLSRQQSQTREAIDGRLTEMLALTRKSSHAEGVAEGEPGRLVSAHAEGIAEGSAAERDRP